MAKKTFFNSPRHYGKKPRSLASLSVIGLTSTYHNLLRLWLDV